MSLAWHDDGSVTRDPVCGMKVDRSSAAPMARRDGATEYFCSASCRDRFEAAPETYLGARPAPAAMPVGTIYTCPMHPEIEQVGPADCPICGMALEPKGAAVGKAGPRGWTFAAASSSAPR